VTGAARGSPHRPVAAVCVGIAAANVFRATSLGVVLAALTLGLLAAVANGQHRPGLVLLALGLGGLWWGSARLDSLDRSPLLEQVDRAERSLVVVTGPPRRARYELRVPATVRRFGALRVDEPILLQLPLGRSPPQGAVLEVLGVIALPRGPSHGFDERSWLRRHGVHVVLHGDEWRIVGHRGGLGGLADRIRGRLDLTLAPGVRGERRAVLVGVVLGEDQGLSDGLRQRFRASGLYHLLAVSGQNVALVAGGVLFLAWLLGIPRWIGELGALAGIGAYVLAVGAQPSVVRAGVAGALGSLAWLTARQRDRWHFLLLGALALLAWNPYNVYDAGFELSFAAVVAIFVLAPRFERFLEGYPIPSGLRQVVAISTACSVATAPIVWLQFHAIPLLAVPANALAAPAVVPLLGLALASAAVYPIAPSISAALGWLNGWCGAYLAGCARLVGGLPFAQVRSGAAAAILAVGALVAATYAWRHGRGPEAGLSAHRR
jgi:competence protein ComEC